MDKQLVATYLSEAASRVSVVIDYLVNVEGRDNKYYEEVYSTYEQLQDCISKVASTACEAFIYLIEHPEITKVISHRGYFALGDAYLISGYAGKRMYHLYSTSEYYDKIVLVEIVEDGRYQYQHWGYIFDRNEHPNVEPTIYTNLVMDR
jgi:hypothetical protein